MTISVCPEEPITWKALSTKVTTESYDLCRNFAAVLQMANEGKVLFLTKNMFIINFCLG